MYRLLADPENVNIPDVVRARLKNADSAALKLAVFLLCGGDVSEAAGSLSLSDEAAARAVQFWLGAGLIEECGDEKKEQAPLTLRRKLSEGEKQQLLKSGDFRSLLRECENCLGRPLSRADDELLFELREVDGLGCDFILMAVSYFCTAEKLRSMRLIARRILDWKSEGVCDYRAGEIHIGLLKKRAARYELVADTLDTEASCFNARDRRYIDEWFELYGYDEKFAAEAAVKSGSKATVSYINGILKSWYQKGFKTIKQTRTEISNTPAASSKKKDSGIDMLKSSRGRGANEKEKG